MTLGTPLLEDLGTIGGVTLWYGTHLGHLKEAQEELAVASVYPHTITQFPTTLSGTSR